MDAMESTDLYPRFIRPRLLEALADAPVVLIHVPRQCGKTTLHFRWFTTQSRRIHEISSRFLESRTEVSWRNYSQTIMRIIDRRIGMNHDKN